MAFIHHANIVIGLAGLTGIALIGGCRGPVFTHSERHLSRGYLDALEREIAQVEQNTATRQLEPRSIDPGGLASQLEIRPEHLDQIEREYSVAADLDKLRAQAPGDSDPITPALGEDLYGRPQRAIAVSLQKAMLAATEHNLDVAFASFGPAIGEAGVVAARAAFDWTFSTNLTWNDTDTPQPSPAFLGGGVVTSGRQDVTFGAGVSRRLTSGGTIGVSTTTGYGDERTGAFGSSSPDPAGSFDATIDYTQPLLRGYGAPANLAEVHIAQNAERHEISRLRGQLIGSLSAVEGAYWDLVNAYNTLVIERRLLDRGIKVRDDIKARRVLDARQAQVADAVARVERRKGGVLRAQTALRRASDHLKLFINDPDLPIGSELLLLPADGALDQPIEFSLADALTHAVAQRPELEQAILDIDDASIRQMLARNSAMPRLDLQAQFKMLSLDDNPGGAWGDAGRGEFIDNFMLGLLFEQPIGNRAAKADERASRLSRMRSVVAYKRTLRAVVLDVKNALDQVVTNYRLIEQARLGRIAQGEALRTLRVEKELTDRGYSVERLNLELNQQEALAAAERSEVAALIDYNRAIADLHAAMGTTLDRNRIDFVVPDLNQVEPGSGALDYEPPVVE